MSTAETLGLVVESESGDERICTCVACNKERHFYWNVEKEVGHCHHCDENFTREQLLEYLIADCQENISDELLQDLAEDRGLPVAAFESAGFGYVDGWYILPVWNTSISLASIRRYKIGGNFYIMGGCQAALFGAEELGDQSRTDEPVYLCEGEWDAIALGWFLSTTLQGSGGQHLLRQRRAGAQRGGDGSRIALPLRQKTGLNKLGQEPSQWI
jgi:hypothetical protein